jgi:hypothetical protein
VNDGLNEIPPNRIATGKKFFGELRSPGLDSMLPCAMDILLRPNEAERRARNVPVLIERRAVNDGLNEILPNRIATGKKFFGELRSPGLNDSIPLSAIDILLRQNEAERGTSQIDERRHGRRRVGELGRSLRPRHERDQL